MRTVSYFSLFSSSPINFRVYVESGSFAIAITLSLIRSIGPKARSFASLENNIDPAVRIMHIKIVEPKERAAVKIASLLVDYYPITFNAPLEVYNY